MFLWYAGIATIEEHRACIVSAICCATSCSFYDAVGDVEEEVLRGLLPPQQPGAAPGEDQQLIGEDVGHQGWMWHIRPVLAYQTNSGIQTSCMRGGWYKG